MPLYVYFPCPGSSGTSFTSNVNPITPLGGQHISFSNLPGYEGQCYHIAQSNAIPQPPPDITINWATEAYTLYLTCDSCVEDPPCEECPPGYTLVDGECTLTEFTPAAYTGGLVPVVQGDTSIDYTKFGLRLYPDISGLTLPLYGYGYASVPACAITIPYSITTNNGAGVVVPPLLSSVKSKLWGCDNSIPTCQTGTAIGNRGRLMETGIWSPGYPDNVELSFEFCVNINTTKQYLIGIAGDNKVKIYVDNILHVFLDVDGDNITCAQAVRIPFTYWHVFPITLNAGNHVIKLSGLNLGGQASFGAEIYDIDLATFQSTLTNAASAAPNCGNVPADIDPYVIFSTKDYIGQYIPDPNDPGVWECPDGYVLDECNGIPQCAQITTVPTIPCAYQLVSCCDNTTTYLASLIDLPESIDNILVGNNAGSSIPVGCYSVIPYTGSGAGIPIFNYEINYVTNDGCNQAPFICDAYCGICVCTRVRVKPEFAIPGSSEVTSLFYWTCELQVTNGITFPISATLDVPQNGSWTDYVCASSFYPSVDIFDFEDKGDCQLDIATDTYECPKYYQIVNCQDSLDVICVSNNLSSEFANGLSIQVSAYPNICWSIDELEIPCDSPVTVVITQSFQDCIECGDTLKTYYKLVNCLEPLVVVYTETDLSTSIGSVVSVNEYPDDCWTVEVSALAVSPVDVTGVIEFASCEECGRQFYLLEDCNTENPEPNIITSTDLSLYVGQVITLEYCPDICWQVSETDVSSQNEVVNITASYTTCSICQIMVLPCICSRVINKTKIPGVIYNYYDCNGVSKFTAPLAIGQASPKVCAKLWVDAPDVEYFGDCVDGICPDDSRPIKSIRPGYNTPGCTPEKYEKIMCNFSEGIYKQVVSMLYGVTTCCGEDSYRWEIRKELIELKAIEDPNYTCQLTGTCGCTGSAPGLTPCVPPTS
jgi:hypothetical protein